MFEETEIVKKVDDALKAKIAAERKLKTSRKADKDEKIPDYNPIYREALKMSRMVCVHAEGLFPEVLFEQNAPNESDKERTYRKNNFKPVTLPAWERAMTTVNRIWNKDNYVVNWAEVEASQKTATPQAYFEIDFPKYRSIFSYFASVNTSNKLKDPNKVLVVKPFTLPTKTNDKGETVPDDAVLIEPIVVCYGSEQVVEFVAESHALILLKEKSLVEFGQRKVKEGNIFEFYDDENIWRITQKGRKNEGNYDYVLTYPHKLGHLPAWKLKGKPEDREGDVIYKSYFWSAVGDLDNALYDASNLQISKVSHVFMEKWEIVDPCINTDCENGKVYKEGDWKICPDCNGTGSSNKQGVLQVHQIKAGDRLNPDKQIITPPAGYIQKDSTILEFLREEIKRQKEEAFANLNIDVSNSVAKGSETALGKKIDREELFSLLLLISDEEFILLQQSIAAIGKMRYGSEFVSPVITKPSNFAIRDANELAEEVKTVKASGMSSVITFKIEKDYNRRRFASNDKMNQIIDLQSKVDRLLNLTNQEILMKLNSGTVAKWEDILHTSFVTFIQEAIDEDEDFLDKEFDEQRKVLVDKAQAKEAEIVPAAVGVEERILKAVNDQTA